IDHDCATDAITAAVQGAVTEQRESGPAVVARIPGALVGSESLAAASADTAVLERLATPAVACVETGPGGHAQASGPRRIPGALAGGESLAAVAADTAVLERLATPAAAGVEAGAGGHAQASGPRRIPGALAGGESLAAVAADTAVLERLA